MANCLPSAILNLYQQDIEFAMSDQDPPELEDQEGTVVSTDWMEFPERTGIEE